MKFIYIILLNILFFPSYGQTKISQDDLIGSWKFIELQDENGVIHTEILSSFQGQETIEVINRNDYIFFKNGDYKYSNKYSYGGGKWTINEHNNTIDLSLRILTNNADFQTLLDYGAITKAIDGYYYQQPTTLRIESYTNNQLIIADNYPYVSVYKKIN